MSETVVVGYDGQEPAERALDHAIETVKAASGTVVVVVAEQFPPLVYDPGSALSGPYDPTLFELTEASGLPDPDKPLPGAQEMLDRALAKVAAAGVKGESAWGIGDPAHVIADAARDHGASKIMIGAHPHGFFARLFSEDVEAEVRRETDCELIVVD